MTEGIREAVLTDISNQVSKMDGETLDFERLVRSEERRVRTLAWRFGVPAHELDDVVQDIFVKAWVAQNRFRGDAEPSTWLTRIAVNHLVSRRRSLRTRIATMVRWQARPFSQPVQPDAQFASREAEARAAKCVRRLSSKLRAVFVLRYLEEMSAAEVAETLSIPEATVRTRAFHARKQLRQMMKDYLP
jgi:RNA polymerase sigma-70 factor (ECF subfamily)